jgi:hypothetical protein
MFRSYDHHQAADSGALSQAVCLTAIAKFIYIVRLVLQCELYRPSDLRLSAKLVPTLADRGRHVVSAVDPYGRNLDFLDCTLQAHLRENLKLKASKLFTRPGAWYVQYNKPSILSDDPSAIMIAAADESQEDSNGML